MNPQEESPGRDAQKSVDGQAPRGEHIGRDAGLDHTMAECCHDLRKLHERAEQEGGPSGAFGAGRDRAAGNDAASRRVAAREQENNGAD